MALRRNNQEREYDNFQQHPSKPDNSERFVTDETAHGKLDSIISALGGSSDTTVTLSNITITTANTEQSQALPANCKGFILRSRNRKKVQLAYTSGQSGTTYMSIQPGTVYEDNNFYTSQTIYFQSTQNGDVIELLAFS